MIVLEEKIYTYKELNELNDRQIDVVAYSRVMGGHVVIGESGEPYKMTIEKMPSSGRGLVPRYSTDQNAAVRLALELKGRKLNERYAAWLYELVKGELITTDTHFEPAINMAVLFEIATMNARQLTIAAILSTQYDVDGSNE